MHSMTGYGSGQTKKRQLELEIHVKSVNGRFLEIRFHLPKEYAPFENDLKQAFGDKWARGTVDVYVHRRLSADSKLKGVKINSANAKVWTLQLKKLQQDLKLKGDVSLRDVLQMPFVLETQSQVPLEPGEMKQVQQTLSLAAEECLKFRAREGVQLKKELLKLIDQLSKCVERITTHKEQAGAYFEQRLQTRLAGLETDKLDPSRLALETALLVDKVDITEELVRLNEHIKACRDWISQDKDNKSQGKTLDFYCQELLREVNTIGSKSQVAAMTQVVIEAKGTIEKFREQVQNVE